MSISESRTTDATHLHPRTQPSEAAVSSGSAVSWSAIFAGAVAAAALSLILLFLGSGLGFGAASPWAQHGVGAATLALSAIAWLTFTQLSSSALGGYLAGRLRNRWIATHSDEVYFRDTAHGLLSWALATLVAAGLLTTAVGSIVSTGAQVGAAAASTVASAASTTLVQQQENKDEGGMNYLVDSLFRKEMALASPTPPELAESRRHAVPEVIRIFANSAQAQNLPAEDLRYLGQLVSLHSGLSQVDAEKRVSATFSKLQSNVNNAKVAAADAADKVRKASAYTALWLFISLLAGAFVASVAATFGGRQRDL